MAIFSGSATGAMPAAGTAIAGLDAASVNSVKLIELDFSMNAAGGGTNIGIGKNSLTGSSQANPMNLTCEEFSGLMSQTTLGTAWSVAPGAPAMYFRRAFHNNAFVSAYVIFTFPRGLSIPTSSSLLLWAIASGTVANFNVNTVIDE